MELVRSLARACYSGYHLWLVGTVPLGDFQKGCLSPCPDLLNQTIEAQADVHGVMKMGGPIFGLGYGKEAYDQMLCS